MDSSVKHFLDSSVVRPSLTGVTAYKRYFRRQFGENPCYISTFVQMEFRRSCLRNLIDFYFVLNLPTLPTFGEAENFWSNRFKTSELKAVLQLAGHLADAHKIDRRRPGDKQTALRQVGIYIKRLDVKLCSLFKNVAQDATRCERARVSLRLSLDDLAGGLSKFLDEFNDVERCRSCCRIDTFLLERHLSQVKGYATKAGATVNNNESSGFLKIAASLDEVLQKGPDACSCKRCETIGDAVIALDAPHNMRLEHTDHSFDHLCPPPPHFKHPSETAIVTGKAP